jgi:hypothetical protein
MVDYSPESVEFESVNPIRLLRRSPGDIGRKLGADGDGGRFRLRLCGIHRRCARFNKTLV